MPQSLPKLLNSAVVMSMLPQIIKFNIYVIYKHNICVLKFHISFAMKYCSFVSNNFKKQKKKKLFLAHKLYQRTGGKFLNKLNKKRQHFHPQVIPKRTEKRTSVQIETCTRMFTAVLLTIAKKKKQSKYPSTDEWINKTQYTQKFTIILHSL